MHYQNKCICNLQAIYAYEPQDTDELRLEIGDIVEVVKKGKYEESFQK